MNNEIMTLLQILKLSHAPLGNNAILVGFPSAMSFIPSGKKLVITEDFNSQNGFPPYIIFNVEERSTVSFPDHQGVLSYLRMAYPVQG